MRIPKVKTAALVVVILAFSTALSFAQVKELAQKQLLKLQIKVEKEVNTVKNGKQVVERQSAENAKRGDILAYTMVYTNDNKVAVKNASIVDPIPRGAMYVINSASGKGAEISFSINGGLTFAKPPITYTVRKADGTTEIKPVPAEKYTHVKWVIKNLIPARGSGEVVFKVKVK